MEVKKVRRPPPVSLRHDTERRGLLLTFGEGTGARLTHAGQSIDIIYTRRGSGAQVQIQFAGPPEFEIQRLTIEDWKKLERR